MSTEKVSLTLDKERVAEAREVAGGRGLASYLNRALRNQLRHDQIAGRLLAEARSRSTVDALVVAHAVEAGGAHVLTGDREDLAALAASHPEVLIHSL